MTSKKWHPSPSKFLTSGQEILLNALFPPRCAGCGRFSSELFCSPCQAQTIPIPTPFCDRCALPFDPLACSSKLCNRCQNDKSALLFARCVWIFGGAPREAIHRFKYAGKWALASRLAPFAFQVLQYDKRLHNFFPEVLVPVPLHPSRQRSRGFNQSELLARELSRLSGVPTVLPLDRIRKTTPQVGLDLKERAANVKGAFTAQSRLCQELPLSGKKVLLIDDVFTTGATLRECAHILQKNGASEIAALTLARHLQPEMQAFFERTYRPRSS